MRLAASLRVLGLSALLAVAGGALLWRGGGGAASALGLRAPRTLSCEELYARRPPVEYVRLTGCRTRFFDASYREQSGAVQEVVAPVVPLREEETVEIRLVLATRDPEARALIGEMRALDKQGDQAAGFAFLAKNAGRMVASRDLSGMIRREVDRNDPTLRRLREIENNLVEDFIVLDEGRRPGLAVPLALICGGLLAWGAALVLVLRGRLSAPAADAPAPAPPPSTPPAQPAG